MLVQKLPRWLASTCSAPASGVRLVSVRRLFWRAAHCRHPQRQAPAQYGSAGGRVGGSCRVLHLLVFAWLILGNLSAVAQRWPLAPRKVRLARTSVPLPETLSLVPQVSWTAPFQFSAPGKKRAVIPLEIQRNLLIVSFLINGAGPFNFMLDSGVGTTIITDPSIIAPLGLHRGQPYRVVGAGGENTGILAHELQGVRLSQGNIVAPNMPMLVLSEDLLNLSGYIGMPIHGILGSELFRSFVVGVEPEEHRLVLTAPAHYKVPRGRRWESLPLTIIASKAYLHLPVQVTDSLALPLRLVLDTGAGHALSLEAGSAPQLAVPAQHLRSDLGRGLSGFIRGSLGRVAALHLGRYRLPAVLTSFPDSAQVHSRASVPRNGNVGFELLKRFSLIIDYPHHRLLLRPNSQYREPFEHDMCGIDLIAAGSDFRRYLVTRVTPDSPADIAGLRADDELLSINFLPTSSLSLTQLSRLFHSANGRTLLLVLRRESGELYTTTLRLKRQI